jgi:hypothetical protein
VQPGYDSRIADSLASRLEHVVRRLSPKHLTIGIILTVLGVFALQISPWFAWLTIGTGLLLLTWHTRMRGTYRGLLYFIALLPVLHWFNSTNEVLFHEDAVTGMVLSRDSAAPLELAYGLIFGLVAIGGLILVIRHRPQGHGIGAAAGGRATGRARSPDGPTSPYGHLPMSEDWTTKRGASARWCKTGFSRRNSNGTE